MQNCRKYTRKNNSIKNKLLQSKRIKKTNRNIRQNIKTNRNEI